jgi:hypothetical protein
VGARARRAARAEGLALDGVAIRGAIRSNVSVLETLPPGVGEDLYARLGERVRTGVPRPADIDPGRVQRLGEPDPEWTLVAS